VGVSHAAAKKLGGHHRSNVIVQVSVLVTYPLPCPFKHLKKL